jgi:hypothetical protein
MKGHPMAFILLTVIALRARRQDGIYLKAGQALIGDYSNYGMSRMQYRTAVKHLKHSHQAAFKTTSRGTIATLIDFSIYDINSHSEQPTEQPSKNEKADKTQPTGNQQITTNNKERMKEEEYQNKHFKNKLKTKPSRSMNYDPVQYAGCIEL